MNLRFQMIDCQTGEILGQSEATFVMNFAPKDAGFRRCLSWCESAVRGIRLKKDGDFTHDRLELRITFEEPDRKGFQSLDLPFDDTKLAVPAVF